MTVKSRIKLKLSNHGFSHLLLPILVVVAVSGVGGYIYLRQTSAATASMCRVSLPQDITALLGMHKDNAWSFTINNTKSKKITIDHYSYTIKDSGANRSSGDGNSPPINTALASKQAQTINESMGVGYGFKKKGTVKRKVTVKVFYQRDGATSYNTSTCTASMLIKVK